MDPRTRWQTLQAYLVEANALLQRGAPSQALPLVEAALDLDPEFLAARDLRDSIIRNSTEEFPAERRTPQPVVPASFPAPGSQAGPASPAELWLRPQAQLADAVDLHTPGSTMSPPGEPELIAPVGPAAPAAADARVAAVAPVAPVAPAVIPAAPAAIEARARQRRVAHCVEVGRRMMAQGVLPAARLALEEARELEPMSTEVAHLFEDLHHLEQGHRQGPWRQRVKVAAAVLLAVGLSVLLNRDAALDFLAREARNARVEAALPVNAPLTDTMATTGAVDAPVVPVASDGVATVDSRVIPAPTGPVVTEAPVPDDGRAAMTVLSTTGRLGAPIASETLLSNSAARPLPSADAPSARTGIVTEPPDAPFGGSLPMPGAAAALPPAIPRTADDSTEPNRAPAAVPDAVASAPAAIPERPVDDDRQVLDVLQRYRAAYDTLDAASARAVWPSVDAGALARAFGDLSSQQLRFTNCGVEVRGAVAQATCRGTARYVPRVGGRQPREEARTWTFALRKSGPQWVIESARVTPR